MYRPDAERDEAERDPLTTFPRRLVEEGIATEEDLEAIRAEVDREVDAATERALESLSRNPNCAAVRLLPKGGPNDGRVLHASQLLG